VDMLWAVFPALGLGHAAGLTIYLSKKKFIFPPLISVKVPFSFLNFKIEQIISLKF
jgi:hypothetical protein